MARFYDASANGGNNTADFIFTDNGGDSSITLPGDKQMNIESGATEDLYVSAGDDLYLTANNDDVWIRADDDIQFVSNFNNTQYYWRMNSEGRLVLPGGGYISNPANSSGDGLGYETIHIIPDFDLVGNDQYLVIDPTAPNHIHIRAGGTQDNSQAYLILGGEKTNVLVNDGSGKVQISSKPFPDADVYQNINSEPGNTLSINADLTSLLDSPRFGTNYVSTGSTLYEITSWSVTEGVTNIVAGDFTFDANGFYSVLRDYPSHEWDFDSDGYLYGPAEGLLPVTGLIGPQSDTDFEVLAPTALLLNGQFGEFLDNTGDPNNQIATVGNVSTAIAEIPQAGRNLIINGSMNIQQRLGTTANIFPGGDLYLNVDRWATVGEVPVAWMQERVSEAPSVFGLSNSLKLTRQSDPIQPLSNSNRLVIEQRLEGQTLQSLLKGTPEAKPLTVSFWVRSNKTGTAIVRLVDSDNNRSISSQYTISQLNTWEKNTITFAPDTTGLLDNDNEKSLTLQFWIFAGSNYTTGTTSSSWRSSVDANSAVGQTDFNADIDNYWQITGVQLETGSIATDFEVKNLSQELLECQRYCYRQDAHDIYSRFGYGSWGSSGLSAFVFINTPVTMRGPINQVLPVAVAAYNPKTDAFASANSITIDSSTSNLATLAVVTTLGGSAGDPCHLIANANANAFLVLGSEL